MEKISKIAILGGGIGGMVCASELKYRLGAKAEITVFDKSSYHTYQPAFLRLALGQRKLNSIRRPLDYLLKQGVNYLHGEIFRLDPENLVLNAEHGDFEFDSIIVALGVQLSPNKIKGFRSNAFNLYSTEGCKQISEALKNFTGGKIAVVISSTPFKGPSAPYEFTFLLDDFFKRKKIRNKVEIKLVTPEKTPFALSEDVIEQLLNKKLDEREVEYIKGKKVKSIGQFVSFGRERFKSDLVIGIPVHSCSDIAVDARLAKKEEWINVNRHNMETEFKNVYAIGDSNQIKLKNGKMLPKIGSFAKKEAQIVAYNLGHKLKNGKVVEKKFQGKGSFLMELGNKKAFSAKGNYYHEPEPLIDLAAASKINYYKKTLYEKYWLNAWL